MNEATYWVQVCLLPVAAVVAVCGVGLLLRFAYSLLGRLAHG